MFSVDVIALVIVAVVDCKLSSRMRNSSY